MLQAKITLLSISAERFLDPKATDALSAIQVNVNFVFTAVERVGKNSLKLPFIITANYLPTVAEIVLKGETAISGTRREIDEICLNSSTERPVPQAVFEIISERVAPELILIGKVLGVPLPLPIKQFFKTQQTPPNYCA